MEGCKFIKAWIGKCGKPTTNGTNYCEEHIGKECVHCGGQATHECDRTPYNFVCGAPLCGSKDCIDKHNKGHDKMAEDIRKKFNPTVKDIKERGLGIIDKETEKAVIMAKDMRIDNKIVKDQYSRALSKATFLQEIGLITQKELLEIVGSITTQIFEDSIDGGSLEVKRGRIKDGR